MKELEGNIWELKVPGSVIVITTNGFVKKNGEAVMGKGIAKEAVDRYPGIAKVLGGYINQYGNRPFKFSYDPELILATLPTKPAYIIFDNNDDKVIRYMRGKFKIGETVPGWACKSDLTLILDGCHKLMEMADKFSWEHVLMPRPGCGNGALKWENVQPELHILDDRFHCCNYNRHQR